MIAQDDKAPSHGALHGMAEAFRQRTCSWRTERAWTIQKALKHCPQTADDEYVKELPNPDDQNLWPKA